MRSMWNRVLLALFSIVLLAGSAVHAAPRKKNLILPAPTPVLGTKGATGAPASLGSLAKAKPQKLTRDLLLARWYWMFTARAMFTRGSLLRADLAKFKVNSKDIDIKLAKAIGTNSRLNFKDFAIFCQKNKAAIKPGLWKWMCKEILAGRISKKVAPTKAMFTTWRKKMKALLRKSRNNTTLLRQQILMLTFYRMSLPWRDRYGDKLVKELSGAYKRIIATKKVAPWGRLGLAYLTYMANYRKSAQARSRALLEKELKALKKLFKKYPQHPEILDLAITVSRRLKKSQLTPFLLQKMQGLASRSHWDFSFAVYQTYMSRIRPYIRKYKMVRTMLENALATSKRLKEPYVALYFARQLNYRMGWKYKKEALELLERYLVKVQGPHKAQFNIQYANLLKYAKRYKDAERLLLNSWHKTGNKTLIYQIVSLYQYNLKDRQKALRFLNGILTKNPLHVEALKRRAYLYRLMNDYDKAEKDYKALLANPKKLGQYSFSTVASFYNYYKKDKAAALRVYSLGIKTFPKYYYNYYNRARLLEKMGKTKRAIADYKKSFQLNPSSTYSVRYYVKLLIRENRGQEALRYLSSRLKKKPTNYYLQLAYVEALQKMKKTAVAERFMLKSNNPRFLLKIANESKRAGKLKKALKFYTAYINANEKKKSGSYYMYHYRARLYHKMGKTAKALADYKRAIKKRPDYMYAYSSLAYYYRYRLKKPAEALKVWNEYLKKKPKDTNAMFRRAALFANLKNYKAAQQEYERALALMKPSVYKINSVSYFYIYKMKRPKLALQLWNDFLEKSPKNEAAYRYRSDVYKRMKMYEEAAKDLSKAIELRPKYYYSYYKLAYLYKYNLRKKEGALMVWEDFIKRNPNNPQGYTYRAQLYRDMKQYDKAVEDYRRAIALNPNRRASYSSLAYFYGYYKIKQYDKVPGVWTMYLRRNPWDSYALRSRAKAWEKIQKWDKALRDWNVVIKKTTSSYYRKYAYQGKARCLKGLGKHKESIALFEDQLKKVRYSWKKRSIYGNLYESYMLVGRYKDAMNALKKSLYSPRYMKPKQRLIMAQLQALTGQYKKAMSGFQKLCYGRRSYRGRQAQAHACDCIDFIQYAQTIMKPPFVR